MGGEERRGLLGVAGWLLVLALARERGCILCRVLHVYCT